MFDGPVKFASRCRACGLDISAFNVGDGPAAFLTLIIGGLVSGLAIALELGLGPPFWVHVLIWIPLASLAVVAGLRAAKAALLWSEFHRGAREHQRRSDSAP